jgi:hypothetical protein
MRGERVLVRPPFHDHDAVIVDRVGGERVVEATRLLRAARRCGSTSMVPTIRISTVIRS